MSIAFEVSVRYRGFRLDAAHRSTAACLAVVGRSGAGKTTLLQALAGLITAERVALAIHDEPLVGPALNPPPHCRGVGYVFQDNRLFPHMTVAANIDFARPYARAPMAVAHVLDLVDLQGFEGRWPASLSGGEIKRVAVARALLPRPRLLLLDEPFAGLDGSRRDALVGHLRRLRDHLGTPMILVSHDARDVEALAQDVVTLEAGRVSG